MEDTDNNQEFASHYKNLKIEPIDYNYANDIPFAEGNIIKYVSRWRYKNGLEDLLKARVYLDYLIKQEESKSV